MKLTSLMTVATMACTCGQLGCSFLLVKGPPSTDAPVTYSPEDGFTCTEANTAPKADVVLAGIGGVINFSALATATGTPPPNQTAEQRRDSENRWAAVFWSGLAIAGVATVSALYGFRATRKCREFVESPVARRAVLRETRKAQEARWLTPEPAGGD